MNQNEIDKYLDFLKFKKSYKPSLKPCEICGSDNTKIFIKKISWNNKKYGVLPIHCCNNCGMVFQNPRFNKNFYFNYYKKIYRDITLNTQTPSKKFTNDQIQRGKKLYNFLKPYLPKKGSMLDVGCSVGLMMKAYIDNNWKCIGNDPVQSHVEWGKNKFRLPVEWIQSEDMNLKKNSLDLITIMGSIDHVFNLNLVMKKCQSAIKKNGILVLEARGNPLGRTYKYFNQSHHRYFSHTTLQLLMIKFGWEPFLTTSFPITGPSRKNTIFCLGRYKGKKISKNFKKLIKFGKKDTFEDVNFKFKYFDYVSKMSPGKILLR